MNISVFGLGYVGCVSIGCLANNGNRVFGVDVNQAKVDLINSGQATIIEKDIDEIIFENHKKGLITASINYEEAVINSDISIICVGTPSTQEGHLNLDYIFRTAKEIATVLKDKKKFHIIAIRSTVLPGTNIKYGKIIEELSGKKRNVDFAIVSNPEFLREGSAVSDFNNPPLTVFGTDNKVALAALSELYGSFNTKIEHVNIEVAEVIKYVNNSFHALKVGFANEIGRICKKMNVDSHEVMNIFCMDTQLNISPYYLKPGFSYGGSCLPKDLKALSRMARDFYIETPIIDNIEKSNSIHSENALSLILKKNKSKILVLGISFKTGTDDLRQSPIIEIIQQLIGKGFNLKLFDKNVNLSKLIGKNKSYISEKLPHIAQYLIKDIDKEIEWADIIVITNKEKDFESLTIPDDKIIIDFARLSNYSSHPGYEGISW